MCRGETAEQWGLFGVGHFQETYAAFWESVECRFRHTKVFGQKRLGHVTNPVGDAERAKFGKISVIKDKNEMAGPRAQTLQHMAMPAGEIPHVAWIEIVGLGHTLRINDGGTNATLGDVPPLGRRRMPVKLAHRARFEPHGDPRDAL